MCESTLVPCLNFVSGLGHGFDWTTFHALDVHCGMFSQDNGDGKEPGCKEPEREAP
jgi:hypothetical protein